MTPAEDVELPAPPAPWIFRARRPTSSDVENMVQMLGSAPLSYVAVGATGRDMPIGFNHDEASDVVGSGDEAAASAEAAIRSWKMFDLGWVHPHRTDVRQEPGQTMAFSARTYGIWTINVCRVVERIEADDGTVRRVGFAYGTLPGHVLSGEERFELSYDRRTGEVRFTIRKFARPNHVLASMGGPVVRHLQRRFSTEAIRRIASEVNR